MSHLLTTVKGLLTPRALPRLIDHDLSKNPKRLAAVCRPICQDMLEQLNYPGAPVLKSEAVEALLEYMYRRAVEIGVPLNTKISAKGFRLGYAEGLVSPLMPWKGRSCSSGLTMSACTSQSFSRSSRLRRPLHVVSGAV
jgi:hypothetical protein